MYNTRGEIKNLPFFEFDNYDANQCYQELKREAGAKVTFLSEPSQLRWKYHYFFNHLTINIMTNFKPVILAFFLLGGCCQ
jgi:hypothetical protein